MPTYMEMLAQIERMKGQLAGTVPLGPGETLPTMQMIAELQAQAEAIKNQVAGNPPAPPASTNVVPPTQGQGMLNNQQLIDLMKYHIATGGTGYTIPQLIQWQADQAAASQPAPVQPGTPTGPSRGHYFGPGGFGVTWTGHQIGGSGAGKGPYTTRGGSAFSPDNGPAHNSRGLPPPPPPSSVTTTPTQGPSTPPPPGGGVIGNMPWLQNLTNRRVAPAFQQMLPLSNYPSTMPWVSPNQISRSQWNNMQPFEQQMQAGMWSQGGYDPASAVNAMQRSWAPGAGVPGVTNWR